jgi:hypothetical protein
MSRTCTQEPQHLDGLSRPFGEIVRWGDSIQSTSRLLLRVAMRDERASKPFELQSHALRYEFAAL